ncbi:MAG: replication-relaxation family protein [Candidatus Kaelpia imicola]|nr:replication-relaxation family protein [Candidatus Kaelpia imicola]
MRITPRDIQLFYWLEKLSFLSTSMVSFFIFNDSIKVARRRLNILKKNNYLLSFDKPSPYAQGRLEQVFYLNKQRENAIRRFLGFKPSFFKLSTNLIVEHDLQVNTCILCFSSACDKTKDYSVESFSVAHKATDLKENLPAISSDIIPDFMIVLRNKKGKSLLFGEQDMGTQVIQRSSGNKDIITKISAYSEYLVNQKFIHFREVFNFPFKGFRVLFILPSATRLKNILDLNKNAGAMLWLTSEKIIPENILSNIWHVPQRAELQAIVKGANL